MKSRNCQRLKRKNNFCAERRPPSRPSLAVRGGAVVTTQNAVSHYFPAKNGTTFGRLRETLRQSSSAIEGGEEEMIAEAPVRAIARIQICDVLPVKLNSFETHRVRNIVKSALQCRFACRRAY